MHFPFFVIHDKYNKVYFVPISANKCYLINLMINNYNYEVVNGKLFKCDAKVYNKVFYVPK